MEFSNIQNNRKRVSTANQNGLQAPFIAPISTPVIQKKLKIGEPDDKYEAEADRMADQVLQMKPIAIDKPKPTNTSIQRKCANCEDEGRIQKKALVEQVTPLIQKRENSQGGKTIASQTVTNSIKQSRGRGKSLNGDIKQHMESGFGTDFSNVRIHTDSNAVNLSQKLNAQAFTVGNDIYFNQGKYAPNSSSGKHLLAHELTHTIQQKGIQNSIQKQDVNENVNFGIPPGPEGYLLPTNPNTITVSYWNGLTTHQKRYLHYNRNVYQSNLPERVSDLNLQEWSNHGEAIAHNVGEGVSGNIDYRGTGERSNQQAVYNSSGDLVTSPENRGTYDFIAPSATTISGHWTLDVNPWIIWGNSPDDSTTREERVNALTSTFSGYIGYQVFGPSTSNPPRIGPLYVCFKKGTLIKTPIGNRPIELLKKDDEVISWNHKTRTTATRKIEKTLSGNGVLYQIVFIDGTVISATGEHPFYIKDLNKYVPVKSLKPGYECLTIKSKLLKIEKIIQPNFRLKERVYNITIEIDHNYFVSDKGVLVHNK